MPSEFPRIDVSEGALGQDEMARRFRRRLPRRCGESISVIAGPCNNRKCAPGSLLSCYSRIDSRNVLGIARGFEVSSPPPTPDAGMGCRGGSIRAKRGWGYTNQGGITRSPRYGQIPRGDDRNRARRHRRSFKPLRNLSSTTRLPTSLLR